MTRDQAKNVINVAMPFVNIALMTMLGVMGFFLRQELDDFKSLRRDVIELREYAAVTRINQSAISKNTSKVWEEIARIRQELAMLPRESPQPWFLARVDKLETSLSGKIQALEVEINRLSVEVAKLGKE